MILGSLPESYNMLITALETRPIKDLTILLVKEMLIQDYQRRMGFDTVESENHVYRVKNRKPFQNRNQTTPFQNRNQTSPKDKSKVKCFGCGGNGHYKNECPNQKTS